MASRATDPSAVHEPETRAAWAGRFLLGDARNRDRYLAATTVALAVIAAAQLLRGELQTYRAILYFGAVCVASLRGGAGPGALALALCALAYGLMPPTHTARRWLEIPDPLHGLVFFVGFAALGGWVASAVREGYLHLHSRRRSAERSADAHRVTAELGVRALAESDLGAFLSETLAAVQQALGCDSVTLLEVLSGGESLRLRDVAGEGRALIGTTFGPAEAPLAFHALAMREPVVVEDLAAQPELASAPLVQAGVVSSLAARIVAPGPGGRPFGIIGAHSRTRARFGADDVSFLQSAANVVGTAVVRVMADARVHRALASERFLADASRQLGLSIDWQQTLERVAKLAVPFLADWCAVTMVGGDGRPQNLVCEADDPARAAVMADFKDRYPVDLSAAHGVGRVLRTGAPELSSEITPEDFVLEADAGAEVRRAAVRQLGLKSFIAVPLLSRDRVAGAIALAVADGPRRYDEEDLRLAQALAGRCAVALENADLYRAAQAATRVREEVLAVVSHDLKTPLAALLVGTQAMERLAPATLDGDDLRRAAVTVRRTAERMGRLVHDLVDVASMDAGRPSVRIAVHDAAAIAREALEAVRGLASDREVTLTAESAESAPLPCDRDRLLQVLTNLLTNAIQVTPPGGRVGVCTVRGSGEVVLKVTDSGFGIPAEDLPHLFERWYRGRRARYPGSGLGLAIARAIVEAHQGRIWAESAEGKGSTFSVAIRAQS
jgi:signal transduction histidine kinase